MRAKRIGAVALAAAIGQFFLAISLAPTALAQRCEPAVIAQPHTCVDGTLSTSVNIIALVLTGYNANQEVCR